MTTRPIMDSADWIRRTAAARDALIARGTCRAAAFHVIEDGDVVSLDFDCAYPQAWGEHVIQDESGNIIRGFVREDAIPVGLVLFWPKGTDVCGEAFDAKDPIAYLQEVEFWDSVPPPSDS